MPLPFLLAPLGGGHTVGAQKWRPPLDCLRGRSRGVPPAGALRSPLHPSDSGWTRSYPVGGVGVLSPWAAAASPPPQVGEGPTWPPGRDRPTRAGPSPYGGFCGAAPEGRGLGFGFLQTRRT